LLSALVGSLRRLYLSECSRSESGAACAIENDAPERKLSLIKWKNILIATNEMGPSVRDMYLEYVDLRKVELFHGTKKMLKEQLIKLREDSEAK